MNDQVFELLRESIKDVHEEIRDLRVDLKERDNKSDGRITKLENFKWKAIGIFTGISFIVSTAVTLYTSQ